MSAERDVWEPTEADSSEASVLTVVGLASKRAYDRAVAEIRTLRERVERMQSALETICPVEDGFTEAFDDLKAAGLIVLVPANEAFRDEFGQDEMYVWAWSPLAHKEEG